MSADNFFLYATSLIFGLTALLACLSMSPAQRLSVAAFLAVPQFFVPGLPVSAADLWVAFMTLAAIPDKRVRLGNRAFLLPVFTLVFAYVLSQFWSESPFSQTNMLIIVRVLFFAVLACYALSVASVDSKQLIKSIRWAVPWILIQAVMTIMFRIDPAVEAQFLHSSVANVLVGPSAAGLFNGFANNVLDPVKAGGLYVNANMASMFFGVAFFLLLAAVRLGASKWNYLWAALAWSAVWATGSKTGAALAIALPIAAIFLPRMTRGISRMMLLPLALILVPVGMWLPDWISALAPAYADDSVTAYGSRNVLWDAAAILFDQHPWLGLGFGGWASQIGALLGFNSLPPHNMVIAAWANSGLLAGIAVIAFIAAVGVVFLRAIFAEIEANTRTTLTLALCSMAWMFIHGMGDNTTIYGETRTALFAAIAMACLYARAPNSQLGAPVILQESSLPLRRLMLSR